jgi:hypothetical protein
MNLMQVDEAVLKSIREVIDNVPVCEVCGGDADTCGCAEVNEDYEEELSEPSGEKEDIIINPDIDLFSAAKQQKVDEWTNAAKLKEAPQHVWVGAREFADKNAANHYAKSIGGIVTPQPNPDHKGFKAVEKKPLSKAEKDAKWNERMPWPSDYNKGRGSRSPISAFSNSYQPKGNALSEGIDADEHFKKYGDEYADYKYFSTSQWAAALGKKDRAHGYKGMYAYKTKKGKWYHELVRNNGELDTDTKWALTPLQVQKLGLH